MTLPQWLGSSDNISTLSHLHYHHMNFTPITESLFIVDFLDEFYDFRRANSVLKTMIMKL